MAKRGEKTGVDAGSSGRLTVDVNELSGGKCPLCKKPSLMAWRPFCSRRCADLDLSKWLTGRYVIAGNSADDDEDGAPGAAEIEALRDIEDL